VALGVTPVACQGISLLTATPNRPGAARNLFRFRDQECSDFVITNNRSAPALQIAAIDSSGRGASRILI
jgi:hypothetical protein